MKFITFIGLVFVLTVDLHGLIKTVKHDELSENTCNPIPSSSLDPTDYAGSASLRIGTARNIYYAVGVIPVVQYVPQPKIELTVPDSSMFIQELDSDLFEHVVQRQTTEENKV